MRAALVPCEPHDGEPDHALVSALKGLGIFPHLAANPLDVRALCVIREELGYRHPGLDAVFAVQGLGSYPVLTWGSPEQKSELARRVADGSALFAFALSEAGAGSDLGAIATAVSREGGDYVLNGGKRFISNAGLATHYTVFARTAPGAKGLSAFLVPATTPGLSIRRMSVLGDHPLGELTFRDCRLPVSARIGDEGAGMRIALGTLDVFRSTVGAAAVGMAWRALDEAVEHVKGRHQFGAPLSALQGVQFLLAESATELEAARLLVHRAAWVKDGGAARVTYEAAVAKLFATEAASRIIDRCLQVHGGVGVLKGSPIERLYREVRSLRIYEGASEVQKVLIARELLGDR